MMQSQMTGQLISQVTVQVAFANQSGAWNDRELQETNFVVVPRKGETILVTQQKKYFSVIDVIHQMAPGASRIIVVVQARA